MKKIIDLENPNISSLLHYLLKDKTTKKNIVWATNSYQNQGKGYQISDEITIKKIKNINFQPRVFKSKIEQKNRINNKAEVFTPSWVCCKINNKIDDEWFEKENTFNTLTNNNWKATSGKIRFPKNKTWEKYIKLKKIEITCGECPFVVSRYDALSGEFIPIEKRIGFLDRKLRIINENTKTEEEWFKWVVKAYKSCYGYEFQGDNLLIGRINLLLTFIEYMNKKWKRTPTKKELKIIANIITWNFFQMDGINFITPFSYKNNETTNNQPLDTVIYDWGQKKRIYFKNLRKEE